MKKFLKRIRKSINNPALQQALDANAERRVKGSIAAFASLPDHQERRQRAHEIRKDVIAHLDKVLAQFIAKVEENGIIVHRAQNANEAIEIALEIVKDSPQSHKKKTPHTSDSSKAISAHPHSSPIKLIAKSKSMVTEEIGLNHALEAAGHRVVETDLGEYIIQLRHETPSHIITPAVHLRRQEVAQLFHEELGIPYTEDIPTLTETARQTLREVFLSAEIGISGVNFGVAESGTLCIVTNEGNGRMVTTMPKTHIAVMGMERLVPTMNDLALMLSLLPRSATTQKISVYTQFIQRPLPDQQRHLILLDNRRSELRNSPINDSLFCIRCGACLNACPVFREIGGHAYNSVYPGPIGSIISAGLFGAEYAPLAQACSICGACADACPVKIDLPKMLLRVRAGEWTAPQGQEGEGVPISVKLGLKAYRRIALAPRWFSAAQTWMSRLASSLKSATSNFIPLPAWTGWGYSKDFPKPAKETFHKQWKKRTAKAAKDSREARIINTGQVIPTTSSAELENSQSLAEKFTHEAELLGSKVIPVRAERLRNSLIRYLQERKVDETQARADVAEYLQNTAIRSQAEASPKIAFGITRAVAAVAETGSILITGENRDQLSASLLPAVHIAILQADDIHATLEDVLALPSVVAAPAASLVSGPSRTADIEMTLTIGVHGPRELIVFLVDG